MHYICTKANSLNETKETCFDHSLLIGKEVDIIIFYKNSPCYFSYEDNNNNNKHYIRTSPVVEIDLYGEDSDIAFRTLNTEYYFKLKEN